MGEVNSHIEIGGYILVIGELTTVA